MMHDEGMLRAYIDGELESEPRQALEAHLAQCADCQDRLAELRVQAGWVSDRLVNLAPDGPELAPSPGAALARFQRRVAADARQQEPVQPPAGSIIGRLDQMRRQLFSRRWQPALIGVLALILVAGLFTLAPVRSAAGQFLGIFRVRKFAAISLNPTQVQNLEASLNGVDNVLFGEPEVLREPGPEQPVGSAGEASALAGFTVRLPTTLPPGAGEPKLVYQSGGAARFKIEASKIQAILDAAGRQDLKLPPGIDQATLEVDVPGMVTARYSTGLDTLELVQAPSPTVVMPPGIDLAELAEIGLQVIGMTPEEARQISQSVDWSSTLVIPVPTEAGSFREVTVDGTNGLLLSSRSSRSRAQQTVLWEKDDIVYGLSGRSDPEVILEAANSMQ
jgi:hypothetical protein